MNKTGTIRMMYTSFSLAFVIFALASLNFEAGVHKRIIYYAVAVYKNCKHLI